MAERDAADTALNLVIRERDEAQAEAAAMERERDAGDRLLEQMTLEAVESQRELARLRALLRQVQWAGHRVEYAEGPICGLSALRLG